MKKALCLMLVLFSLLALVGCNRSQAERNSILGCWETEIDVSVLGLSLSNEAENQTITATYELEFYEDGTGKCSVTFDEASAAQIPNLPNISNINTSLTYTYNGSTLEIKPENENAQTFSVSFSGEKLLLDGRAPLELTRKK